MLSLRRWDARRFVYGIDVSRACRRTGGSCADQSSAQSSLRSAVGKATLRGAPITSETAPSAPYGGGMASVSYRTRKDEDWRSRPGARLSIGTYTTDDADFCRLVLRKTVFGSGPHLATQRQRKRQLTGILRGLHFRCCRSPAILRPPQPPTPLDYGVSAETTGRLGSGARRRFACRAGRRSIWPSAAARQRLLDDNVNHESRSYGGGYSYSVQPLCLVAPGVHTAGLRLSVIRTRAGQAILAPIVRRRHELLPAAVDFAAAPRSRSGPAHRQSTTASRRFSTSSQTQG